MKNCKTNGRKEHFYYLALFIKFGKNG